MTVIIVTIVLYGLAFGLLVVAHRRNRRMPMVAIMRMWREFTRLLPRLAVGIIGAGFIARMLPPDLVSAWLGSESGVLGVVIATFAGAMTPGGPVVGYALGAAALKAGAGAPQVVAFVTGWSLFTFNRMIVWEIPTMPAWFVRLRLLVSLPLPFLAAALAAFLQ